MALKDVLDAERAELVRARNNLVFEKDKLQAQLAEVNTQLQAARQALQDFDDDVALLPARLKS